MCPLLRETLELEEAEPLEAIAIVEVDMVEAATKAVKLVGTIGGAEVLEMTEAVIAVEDHLVKTIGLETVDEISVVVGEFSSRAFST